MTGTLLRFWIAAALPFLRTAVELMERQVVHLLCNVNRDLYGSILTIDIILKNP
ncbi:unnamed protein product [Cylicocyclus nassatus]|uniref:Uncharacterized protein n=1 Tax=Cylicocyclus nassatus TaxID=53992 RepID=A0AA36HEN8_CYLNA|nr:unnamed protein product [Cylicocyclus nassatus]